jgi:hypothetical protein
VTARIAGSSRSPRLAAVITTDAQGGFTYRVARGPGRSFDFAYTAFSTDAGSVAHATAKLKVRAGVRLRTSTSRVTNGTRLRFKGRVLGRTTTRRPLVTIYALAPGPRRRIPVETIRARVDGRFSYAYRFARIVGPSVYRFEARVPKQTGFPYLAGASHPVTVRGRP